MSTSQSFQNVIAVTGSMGSGKSSVCTLFERLGAFVLSADEIAREIAVKGSEAHKQIVRSFGREMLDENGEIDRKKLGNIVFGNKQNRLMLEQITHPLIRALALKRFSEAENQSYPLLVYECPLLFESGEDPKVFKAVVMVSAPEKECILRVMKCKGLTESQVRARIGAQLGEEDKRAGADYVIDNSGSLEELEKRVRELCEELREED